MHDLKGFPELAKESGVDGSLTMSKHRQKFILPLIRALSLKTQILSLDSR